MSSLGLWAKSGGGNGCSRGGRRSGVKEFALGGVAWGNCASRTGARGGGAPCATRGGGEAARERQFPGRPSSPERETGVAAGLRIVEEGERASKEGSGTRRGRRGLVAL